MSLRETGKSRHWWTAIIGSVGFCLVGLALGPGLISPAPKPAPAPVEPQPPTVTRVSAPVRSTATAATTNPSGHQLDPIAPSADLFDCMISANDTIEIGSSILGVIESIAVERSDYVEAGQVLATLESSVEQAAVRVAQARAERTVEVKSTEVSLRLGKKRRTRAANLYQEKSMSLDLRDEIETEAQLAELGVEQAKEDHRLAKLQLEQAQASLARRTIRSPVPGFVVDRLMSAGEVVDEETILTIAQIDPLRVDVILPTPLFGSVAQGDPVEIVPEPPLDQARVGRVAIVDRVLDGASGTFGVRLLLPNPEHDLPGGLRCQARLLDRDSEVAAAEPSGPEVTATP